MESLLLTIVLIIVMVVGLNLLARAWVRSSRLGGYRVDHGPDGLERRPAVREDDDAPWPRRDDQPKG